MLPFEEDFLSWTVFPFLLTIPTLESIYELRRSFGDYTSYPNLATHT
jgi:hypothetical protein